MQCRLVVDTEEKHARAKGQKVHKIPTSITSGLETGTADPEYFFDLSKHFAESAG